MNRHLWPIIFLLYFGLASCVTVNVPDSQKSIKRAPVSYSSPPGAFDSFSTTGADKAWKNGKNGNILSFRSSCNDPYDPSLEQLFYSIQSELENPTVIEQSYSEIDGRRSLEGHLTGWIDGISTEAWVSVFKKNSCSFIVSLIGKPRTVADDKMNYNGFIKGFKAP